MSAQLSSTLPSRALVERGATRLWSAGEVALVSFFLGFPGGIAMAAINWYRMGLARKAVVHVAAGVLVATALTLISLFFGEGWTIVFGLLAAMGFLLELYRQTKTDLAAYEANGGVVYQAGLPTGCLVGVGALVAWALIVFSLVFVLLIFAQVLIALGAALPVQ